jgi:hypothetical protein
MAPDHGYCGEGQEAPTPPRLAVEGGVPPGVDWPPDCWLLRLARFPRRSEERWEEPLVVEPLLSAPTPPPCSLAGGRSEDEDPPIGGLLAEASKVVEVDEGC